MRGGVGGKRSLKYNKISSVTIIIKALVGSGPNLEPVERVGNASASRAFPLKRNCGAGAGRASPAPRVGDTAGATEGTAVAEPRSRVTPESPGAACARGTRHNPSSCTSKRGVLHSDFSLPQDGGCLQLLCELFHAKDLAEKIDIKASYLRRKCGSLRGGDTQSQRAPAHSPNLKTF